ncbi:hypothetical protein PVK06_019799 [Gossypium arboreum]|uniref:Uncharacterized protein n=1 Tax=Gossypium arboreum TaxID=29729 RepID=A0ABR0PKR5_GOSAR|nr:hypothetical protein PVK06_019799 [Gossypium arboreum]
MYLPSTNNMHVAVTPPTTMMPPNTYAKSFLDIFKIEVYDGSNFNGGNYIFSILDMHRVVDVIPVTLCDSVKRFRDWAKLEGSKYNMKRYVGT